MTVLGIGISTSIPTAPQIVLSEPFNCHVIPCSNNHIPKTESNYFNRIMLKQNSEFNWLCMA